MSIKHHNESEHEEWRSWLTLPVKQYPQRMLKVKLDHSKLHHHWLKNLAFITSIHWLRPGNNHPGERTMRKPQAPQWPDHLHSPADPRLLHDVGASKRVTLPRSCLQSKDFFSFCYYSNKWLLFHCKYGNKKCLKLHPGKHKVQGLVHFPTWEITQ